MSTGLESEYEHIYKLMGLNQTSYLNFLQVYKFMKKHGKDTSAQDQAKKDAIFAKDFFEIIDEDGKGVSLKEISFPLIALGLAKDSQFVKKVMMILAPKKFGKGIFEDELTMREFAGLF